MELRNEFDVAVPVDQAWAVLTDLERIAPCLPGAQLQEVEGDEYRGIVKVKVGPITAQYKGKATFASLDAENHQAVLQADGRDTRGQGNASANIVAELTESAVGTHVVVTTDLNVTGKVAQFGRGAMADISSNLMAQFVTNLETMVLGDDAGAAEVPVVEEPVPPAPAPATDGPPAAEAQPGVRRIDAPEAAPLQLSSVMGGRTLAKLAVPLVVVLLVVVVVVVLLVA
jgi:carbon monoxide dehydrogenase subunit G